MARKYRKSRWMRGSRTHGWGVSGQHRGKGSRGGFGMAGGHKHKWSWIVKYKPSHFGKRGFQPPMRRVETTVNVGDLEELAFKLGVPEGGELDLENLGFTKLLGSGKLAKPLRVKVRRASSKALEKVKSIGGEVILLENG